MVRGRERGSKGAREKWRGYMERGRKEGRGRKTMGEVILWPVSAWKVDVGQPGHFLITCPQALPSQARQLRLLTRARRSGALALESCRFRRRCRRCPAATERSKHTRGQKRAKQRKIADNWRQCLEAANLPETMMVRRSAGCSGSTTKDPAWKKSVCIWISNCSHEHGSQIELDC